MNVTLDVGDAGAYYDDKRSPSWLNSDFGITEYGHRGVPNVYLNAAYKTAGVWNAAHYGNAALDAAIKTFVESSDVQAQKAASKKIQETLLDDSPIVTTYFADILNVARKALTNYGTTGMGHLVTEKTTLS